MAVLAPPEAVMRAVREVTTREILMFRFLTRLRGFTPPARDERILDAAQRSGFLELVGTERELVFGALVMPRTARRPGTPDEFRTISGPGYAKAVLNFRVEPQLAMCVVSTETRVWTTDDATRRKFALYWWTIRVWSGLIRRMWLRAIRRRAERIGS
jgi:hypothetical protein